MLSSLYGTNPQRLEIDTLEIVKSDWTKIEIMTLIDEMADTYNVSATVMQKVIQCESSYNPKASNRTSREDSWGLAQINRMAHPYISKEQAIDPVFATEFLAKNLAKGKGSMWSCYQKYYG